MRVGKRGTRTVTARAAAAPPLAIIGVDPNITISGLEGYRAGLPIDTLLVTGLFGVDCTNGGQVTVVETRDREALEREVELSNSKYFDRSKRIVPHWVSPDTVISGHEPGGRRQRDDRSRDARQGQRLVVDHDADLAARRGHRRAGRRPQGPDLRPAGAAARAAADGCRGDVGYRGSLSGSATITSLAGVITSRGRRPTCASAAFRPATPRPATRSRPAR